MIMYSSTCVLIVCLLLMTGSRNNLITKEQPGRSATILKFLKVSLLITAKVNE